MLRKQKTSLDENINARPGIIPAAVKLYEGQAHSNLHETGKYQVWKEPVCNSHKCTQEAHIITCLKRLLVCGSSHWTISNFIPLSWGQWENNPNRLGCPFCWPCGFLPRSRPSHCRGQYCLTLYRAQRPKMSTPGRGQNVPKHPVAIDKLRCFQTWKFPYNLARISWIITVRDFRYFLPCHLHCHCVQSKSERVF